MEASVLSKLVDLLLQVGTPVVTLFAMWAAHRLISVFEAKTKMTVPVTTQATIDDWVQKGVMYAEEKAHAAAANKLATVTGPEKLEMALGLVMDLADKYGMANLAKDHVSKLVESKLMDIKMSNTNA